MLLGGSPASPTGSSGSSVGKAARLGGATLLAMDRLESSRPRLPIVAVVCAALVAMLGVQSSNAQTSLHAVRDQQARVRDELASENAAVDVALGREGALRARERRVTAELQAKEAELADARDELTKVRAALARTKRRLTAAGKDFSNFLVFIYEHGEIDETQLLLDAHGFSDLLRRESDLGGIQAWEGHVVDRFRKLRTAQVAKVGSTKKAVARIDAARNAIESRRQALAASRAAAQRRAAELQDLRDKRHALLVDLVGKEKNMVEALSKPQPAAEPQAAAPQGAAPSTSVAPPAGARARLNSDGTATAPAGAPEAVKAVIAAANQITNTPYIWGGGHGSFDSPGYDCSGSVSFALHGGGFLSSPLDSTGLMTWGEAGPGNWITVYANSGHAYMVVAGLRYDTSGAPPRWQTSPAYPAGFAIRHPSGY
jgi:cell wall-associated NlpC family hydrolase